MRVRCTRHKLPRAATGEVTQDVVNLPATGGDNLGKVVCSLESQGLEVLLGLVTLNRSEKVRLPLKESRVLAKSCAMGHREPRLPHSLGILQILPKSKFPDRPWPTL